MAYFENSSVRKASVQKAGIAWLLATACALTLAAIGTAHASVGLTELPAKGTDGPVTVFYPSSATAETVTRGNFRMQMAPQGQPVRGNNRLVVISHGSGGSPWTQVPFVQKLVDAGFVVAMPEHQGDNWHDTSKIGPDSWKLRPVEVSHAIDAVLADARFAPLVDGKRVGMYGMSAGGHTALTLAGGRWSPSLLLKHCEAHLEEDFASCAGPSVELTGGMFDGAKKTVVMSVIRRKLDDTTFYGHTDPRITVIVAEVPFAVDFDVSTLAAPPVPLGLMRNGKDPWLTPRFHIDPVIAACKTCEFVSDLPNAGHGSLLWLEPAALTGRIAYLLGDPPDFDRAQVAPAQQRAVQFLQKNLAVPLP